MKNRIFVILLMMLLPFFAGCGESEPWNEPEREYKEEHQVYIEDRGEWMCENVIDRINERDAEGLVDLFCQYDKENNPDLMEQAETFLESFGDRKIKEIEHSQLYPHYDHSGSVANGYLTIEVRCNVILDTGEKNMMQISFCDYAKIHPEDVGVDNIRMVSRSIEEHISDDNMDTDYYKNEDGGIYYFNE